VRAENLRWFVCSLINTLLTILEVESHIILFKVWFENFLNSQTIFDFSYSRKDTRG
jgi:hypothetical protein